MSEQYQSEELEVPTADAVEQTQPADQSLKPPTRPSRTRPRPT